MFKLLQQDSTLQNHAGKNAAVKWVLEFCVDNEPHTCRKLSQLLDFGLTSDNRVSQVGNPRIGG